MSTAKHTKDTSSGTTVGGSSASDASTDFLFLGGFDQAGNTVAPGIDPEILRDGGAMAGKKRRASVSVSKEEEEEDGGEGHADFAALQIAARMMEKKQQQQYSTTEDEQVAAIAKAVQEHELRQQQWQQQQQQQQGGFSYSGGSGSDAAGASTHNLFGGSLGENYEQYLRQDPKVQQQLREMQRSSLISQGLAPSSSGTQGGGLSMMNTPPQRAHLHHRPHENSPGGADINGKRRIRLRWSEEETQNLVDGCKVHGVGNWKKILMDPRYGFNNRTAVDLKDRFRTSFPEEYARLYPNARTHKSKRVASGFGSPQGPAGQSALVKINRKERRLFTREEDHRLLEGFERHGAAWSKIQRDESLGLGDRRSTDLRDRFRNAFPDRYVAAGYKGRDRTATGGSRPQSTGMGELDDYIKRATGYGSNNGGEPSSPSFKAARAAFTNAMDGADSELVADASRHHQEEVMSSIKLAGLNDDGGGDDGAGEDEDDAEIRRQVELERQRLAQEQQQAQYHRGGPEGGVDRAEDDDGHGGVKQENGEERHTGSASPSLVAAAAAAAPQAAEAEDVKSSIKSDSGIYPEFFEENGGDEEEEKEDGRNEQ